YLPSKAGFELRIPVMVMALVPDKYLTVFQTFLSHPKTMDWAIYMRPEAGGSLNKEELDKAHHGMYCLDKAIKGLDPDAPDDENTFTIPIVPVGGGGQDSSSSGQQEQASSSQGDKA